VGGIGRVKVYVLGYSLAHEGESIVSASTDLDHLLSYVPQGVCSSESYWILAYENDEPGDTWHWIDHAKIWKKDLAPGGKEL
jgi:hypothetical protein